MWECTRKASAAQSADGTGLHVRHRGALFLGPAKRKQGNPDAGVEDGSAHAADIPLRGLITVQIAHRLMGVGGENSWGAWPRPGHVLKAEGTYEYAFVLQPF